MTRFKIGSVCLASALALSATHASAAVVLLTQLTGSLGTAPADQTAIYRANLGSVSGSFLTITITDVLGLEGGSPGKFSGFDLDAIMISETLCATAACVGTATPLNVFDFVTAYAFTPGTIRTPPNDTELFGTNPGGTTVNNGVATLGAFDAFSSITNTANGFLSLGDGGSITFTLNAPLLGTGRYLYIGEVGDNGEDAASTVTVAGAGGPDPQAGAVPEPATWAMMLAGFGVVGAAMRRRQRIAVRFA